jgi:hypothetical protein
MVATKTPKIVPIDRKPLSIVERFCANCRQLMEEQNLSQVALTERISKVIGRPITRKAIMQKIDGTNEPSIRWIEIYARAFGVTIDEILT